MSNSYYNPSGNPGSQTRALSSVVRDEFVNVGAGFDGVQTALAAKAPSASPALTGTPTAPTAVAGTNTDQIATTAFVTNQAFSSSLPGQGGNAGKFLKTDGTNASWATSGDVSGPASATDSNVVVFDGATGKLIKDSGVAISSIGNANGAASSTDGGIVLFSGIGGKTLKTYAGSGIAKLTSGVVGTATAGTDYQAAITSTGILKGAGSGSVSAATAGTDYVAPGTATTFTATQTFKGVTDTVYTITDGAAFEINPANGAIQVVTLGAARTPAATNFVAGQSVLLGIDDGTAYTITWTTVNPTWVKAGGTASAPTLATTGYTWVLLWKVGSTIYAANVGSP